MTIRQLPYRVGSRVRVYDVHGGYRLPEGLPNGAQVIVIAIETGLRVVEFENKRFKVPQACINSGFRAVLPERGETQTRRRPPGRRSDRA